MKKLNKMEIAKIEEKMDAIGIAYNWQYESLGITINGKFYCAYVSDYQTHIFTDNLSDYHVTLDQFIIDMNLTDKIK